MVSHHFVYQLVLFALIWLFVVLHLIWSKRPVTAPATPTEPEPLKPKRYRSTEPKPFEGLTHKPHCALCERDTAHLQSPPPVPPDPMPSTNRRPREVDTSHGSALDVMYSEGTLTVSCRRCHAVQGTVEVAPDGPV